MMSVFLSYLSGVLELFSCLIVLVSLSFLCLKIKSSKRSPEFLGVPGTLVVKNPDDDEDVPDSRCEDVVVVSGSLRELPEPPLRHSTKSQQGDEHPQHPQHPRGVNKEKEAHHFTREDFTNNNEIIYADAETGDAHEVNRDAHPDSLYSQLEARSLKESSSKRPLSPSPSDSSSSYDRLKGEEEHPYAQLHQKQEEMPPPPPPNHPPSHHPGGDEEDEEEEEEGVPPGLKEHEYATLGAATPNYNTKTTNNTSTTNTNYHIASSPPPTATHSSEVHGKAPTYMTLSEANSEDATYAAIEGTYARIGERPSVDDSGYTLVNKKKHLPPPLPPTSEQQLYAQVEKLPPSNRTQQQQQPASSSFHLEELYAKVMKGSQPQRVGPRFPDASSSSDGYEILIGDKVESSSSAHPLSRKDSANYEVLPEFRDLRRQDSSVGYETLPLEKDDKPAYEDCCHPSNSDPPYAELLKEDKPKREEVNEEEEGYETIPRISNGMDHNRRSNNNNNSKGESEDLRKTHSRHPSVRKDSLDYDPAYEVMTKAHSEPAYETIESQMAPFGEGEKDPASLIYMSVQDTNPQSAPDSSSSHESIRRASVVVIERRLEDDGSEDENKNSNNKNNNTHSSNIKEGINSHIFV